MTYPAGDTPDGFYNAINLPALQDEDHLDDVQAGENEWLQQAMEMVRTQLFEQLLGGFNNVPAAIMDAIKAIVEAVTGLVNGGLDDLVDWANSIGANFMELLSAFRGEYDGNDFALNTIQDIVAGLRRGVTGLIDMARIPQITLSQLSAGDGPNLLTGFGGFDSADTMDGDGVWVWDAAVGRGDPGAASAFGDGTRKVLTSEAVAVAADQAMRVAGWVRIDSATGTGDYARLELVPEVSGVAGTPVLIGAVTAGGTWAEVVDEHTVTGDTTHVRVRLTVEPGLTGGTVWWDDVSLRKTAKSLPQQWISGLADTLGDILDWVGSLVNSLLGALGVPAVGDLWDRIMDLADEVGDWLDDTQQRAGELVDLIGDLLNDPVSVIGELPVFKIAGLAGELASKASNTIVAQVQNFLLSLANAILQGIRRVPVVGGNIADRIEDVIEAVTGFRDDTDDAVQSVAHAATVRTNSVVVHASSLQSQVNALNASIFQRTNHSLSQTIIPGAESTFAYWMLNIGATTISVTSPVWALIRTQLDDVKNVIAFPVSSVSASGMTAAYVDVYVFNEDGTKSLFQTINFMPLLAGDSNQWVKVPTADLDVGPNVLVGVQIRREGSGSITLRGRNYGASQGVPEIIPGNVSMRRPTSDAPALIAAEDGTWSANSPYLEYGNSDAMQFEAPPQDYYDGFAGSSLSADWSNAIYGDGSENFEVSGGVLRNTYTGLSSLSSQMMFRPQTRRASCEVSFTVVSSEPNWCGVMINRETSLSEGGGYVPRVTLYVRNNLIRLTTHTVSDGLVERATAAVSNIAGSRWTLDYNSETRRYNVYRDSEEDPTIFWVDTGNVVPATRRAGVLSVQQLTSRASSIDDFRFRDTYTLD